MDFTEESVYGHHCCWSAWTVNDPSLKAAPHPGINWTRRPLVHYTEKTGILDQPYWARSARQRPPSTAITASAELRLRATTSPQIGVRGPLYSVSGRQCGTPAPAGGQYPLKPLGDTSPVWPCHLSRKACSTRRTQSDHAGRLTVDLPCAV